MKVSSDSPFELIYSLYKHEYLGYLFESFVVQLDTGGDFSFVHQNISSKNAHEFDEGIHENDYKIIRLIDEIQQDMILKKYQSKKQKPFDFFVNLYDVTTETSIIKGEIESYIARRRVKILESIGNRRLFEMGKDGNPVWREIRIISERASILFHFRKNESNTHYFPTVKLQGEKVDFLKKNAYLLCNEPAWIVVDNQLFTFKKPISGKKLLPFFQQKIYPNFKRFGR